MVEVETLARDAAPATIRRLREMMDSPDGRISIAACNAILDPALGKPAITVDHIAPVSHDATQPTDAELMAIVAGDKRTH